MKYLILLMTLIYAAGSYAQCGNSSNNFCQAKIERVYDGDTFYVNIPKVHPLFGEKLGVRVFGIDTPELRGGSEYEKQMAKKAKAFTYNFLSTSKRVDLKDCVRGKYFRIVCKVYADDKSLADALIENSLAVPYKE